MAYPWSREADLIPLIKQAGGFLETFCQYGYTRMDAPLMYHVGNALSLLSSVCPPTMCIPDAPGQKLIANFYTLILGKQGYDRKSTSVNMALDMLADAAPGRLGSDPGSGEGLISSLAEQPQQLLGWDEWGDFLARTQSRRGGNYQSDIKPKLLKAFDGTTLSRSLSRRKVIAENPRLAITAAVNPALLAKHSEWSDFRGGFFSRFFFCYAQRERRMARGTAIPQVRQWCVDWLKMVAESPPDDFYPCTGISQGAMNLWEPYSIAIEETVGASDEDLCGSVARAPTIALKIALLIHMGRGDGAKYAGNYYPWSIEPDVMEVAIELANRSFQGAVCIYAGLAGSPDMQDRKSVLDAIPPKWIGLGQILRDARLLKRRGMQIIETLLEEGTIEASYSQGPRGMQALYRIVPGVIAESGLAAAVRTDKAVRKQLAVAIKSAKTSEVVPSNGGFSPIVSSPVPSATPTLWISDRPFLNWARESGWALPRSAGSRGPVFPPL